MDNKFLNKLSSFLFYFSIFLFIIAFNFAHNPPSGWYQQSLPNINGASIRDITFTDSLNGYLVTSIGGNNSYILKTTNGGDNWTIKFSHNDPFVRLKFINASTGFTNAYTKIFKTTDSGENWFSIDLPQIFGDDMYVLNEDTIWLAMSEGFTGGVFRTTNGGTNWIRQYSGNNPDKIYMFNSRIGFIANNKFGISTKKTTDGGFNWFTVLNEGFTDIYFIDSLTGWKCWNELDSIKKTTNGGVNWTKLLLPPTGGFFSLSAIRKFSFINKDTIWGVGAGGNTSLGFRGLIYKSTNGGQTWGYQLPDINAINIGRYFHIDFINKSNGWAYANSATGVHTITGGDTTYYITSVSQIAAAIPKDYSLYQNYPNPFNPFTTIKYELKKNAFVKLAVFDIAG